MTDNRFPENFTLPHTLSGLPENTPILVAFSGGADSSVLLRLVAEYGKAYGATVYAAHVNHMIRGEEADRDEQHCRDVAEALGIKLFVKKADVPALAKERGESVETCARNVRYEFFDSLMNEYNVPLLATAHNANDNLETMLFNMVRGSGLAGMCGIPQTRPCGGGKVIRPILRMSREEILELCERLDISYVTDSTNTDTDYTRNKIRSLVIPTLKEINSSAVDNATRLAGSLRADLACLEGMTDMFLESIEDDLSVNTNMITDSPRAISGRAIMALYKEATSGASLEAIHLDAIMELCRAAVPHSATHLPAGMEAVIESGRLYIRKRPSPAPKASGFDVTLCEGENVISEINAKIIIGNSQYDKNVYKNSILLYFASDKIIGGLKARDRRAGDKIRIHGVNKSIKKLMCDKKIPLDIRGRIPVIYDDEGILAVPFVGISDRAWTKQKQDSVSLILQLL